VCSARLTSHEQAVADARSSNYCWPSNAIRKRPHRKAEGHSQQARKSIPRRLYAHWEANGAAALDICFKEDPVTYCKIVAGTVPRDYRIETAKITELAEDELDRMIEQLREHALAERQERAFELNPAPLVLLNGR